jgi:hypothetical protein
MTALQPTSSAATAGRTADEAPPAWVRFIGPAVPLVPVVGLAISSIAQHAGGSRGWTEVIWQNSVGWLVGAFLFMTSTPHLLMPGPVARSIGWAPSPFQWELGSAALGMAIAGVMAAGQPRAFSLAVIIVFTTFLWGAAIGHVREMVARRNFAGGNAGPIFFYDVLAPAALIWLYLATG